MAFTVVPMSSGNPTTGYSQPDRVSFCIQDDGSGGQVALNSQGVITPTVTGARDIKTLFTSDGVLFNSYQLLRAFKVTPSAQAACDQFFKNLNIQINALSSVGISTMPGIDTAWGVGGGPANAPYLLLCGPGAAGMWRFDISLRHSIPG